MVLLVDHVNCCILKYSARRIQAVLKCKHLKLAGTFGLKGLTALTLMHVDFPDPSDTLNESCAQA